MAKQILKSLIVGVAGGSGSGKSFFSSALKEKIGQELCEIVYQDNFYRDQSSSFDFDGGTVNFDHPDSIDFSLLANCLQELRSGERAQIPIYDFVTHKRRFESLEILPKRVIIVDGILIFHPPNLRKLFDRKIFFDTPEDLRYQRRLERDVKERGRTPEGVHLQFMNQVKPMHDQFVEPSKEFADTVLRDLLDFEKSIQEIAEDLLRQPRGL